MLNISSEQKKLLLKYAPETKFGINEDDINQILEKLDAKITEIRSDAEYELNAAGLELQKLYDELYNQN